MSVVKKSAAKKPDSVFSARLARHYDELKWLYYELYHNDAPAFDWLIQSLEGYYADRSAALRKLDAAREADPDWYRRNDLLGMMLYAGPFAKDLKGVKSKLPYLAESGVNYVHLMPLLESPKGRSDGGYAVSDFRAVQPELGTMKDLEALTSACHKQGMSVCLDFVMNHTSEDHVWAKAARAGDPEARKRYFFYDNWDVPNQFEQTVPQVFPTTAPGSFTWLEDCRQIVMTSFYPYQWDLNYANPVVFNDMVGNMLYLANRGIDILRLDAVPYIWKQLGTNCRNLPQVHTIVRMMRMIGEIVCPGILLLGEVVMEPAKVVPYFGTVDKPECHMLYNVTTMASTWHTVATGDARLLRSQMDQVDSLPKEYVFLNYLRCHDDIGWGLDYPFLRQFGIDEVAHKQFLSAYFTGAIPESPSRGELYNSDPTSGDARQCGTTASLCGVERAVFEQNEEALTRALQLDTMLHAYMLSQSGIPMLYAGDEIGQLNDYTYHSDPEKWADSRYLHRGNMNWEHAEMRHDLTTRQGRLFEALRKLEKIRAESEVFDSNADVYTLNTWDDSILGLVRLHSGKKLVALFNFSGYNKMAWIDEPGEFTDLLTGEKRAASGVALPPYGFAWLLQAE